MPRFIFVAGGVMSGIGKGIATSSIARILKSKGFKITAIKIDPYINVDAGTMNPVEHGEVFVMDDGTECDQDIGNYERFLGETLTTDNYITTGRVYQAVIDRERNLQYGGRCVEVVPDIPNEVIARIRKAAKITKADFVLIEIGGTIGEYQNMLFLEAARMMKLKALKQSMFILVSYLPIPDMIGEMKTKPTQTAVRLLNEAGIQPDIILGRSKAPLDEPRKRKISIFCNISKDDIISSPDINPIYKVPINYENENLGNKILKKFGLRSRKQGLNDWLKLVESITADTEKLKIAIAGKYFVTGKFALMDSYISVIEAIKHACWSLKRKPEIHWLSAEKYEKQPLKLKELKKFDGVIVPGGFGKRGIEGKIKVIEFLREQKIPFLGLCLGMQLAVIEFARNVCNLKQAHSTEFAFQSKEPVIDVMLEQKNLIKEKRYGGTMRLGAYKCRLKKGTKSFKLYGNVLDISERHRHRYEFNNEYRKILEKNGIIMAGVNLKRDLVEIIELKNHPFFIASQFHPEFKSNPLKPHPLFSGFIRACIKNNAI
ncbi:MAG: CTP synthase [Patescibacteria group bacterium]|nr:CTP synthase [Patescibacteria group bacterium]